MDGWKDGWKDGRKEGIKEARTEKECLTKDGKEYRNKGRTDRRKEGRFKDTLAHTKNLVFVHQKEKKISLEQIIKNVTKKKELHK